VLIDSHVHVGRWKYFDDCGRAYRAFPDIVSFLQKRGFQGAVLMPSELKSNDELLHEILSFREEGNPFRCWFFPWLNPHKEEDTRFARDHLQEIDGFKFHPSLDRARFSSADHREFLHLAGVRSIPVLVHCGAWLEMAHYRFVLDVAEQYPEVNFILAHQGGTTYELKMEATKEVKVRGLSNLYFDIAGTHEYWLLEWAVDQVGAERLLLGSDFPIRDASIYPLVVSGTRLREVDKDLIRGNNLLRLMSKGNEDI